MKNIIQTLLHRLSTHPNSNNLQEDIKQLAITFNANNNPKTMGLLLYHSTHFLYHIIKPNNQSSFNEEQISGQINHNLLRIDSVLSDFGGVDYSIFDHIN